MTQLTIPLRRLSPHLRRSRWGCVDVIDSKPRVVLEQMTKRREPSVWRLLGLVLAALCAVKVIFGK
jgi:hypothetical protein